MSFYTLQQHNAVNMKYKMKLKKLKKLAENLVFVRNFFKHSYCLLLIKNKNELKCNFFRKMLHSVIRWLRFRKIFSM